MVYLGYFLTVSCEKNVEFFYKKIINIFLKNIFDWSESGIRILLVNPVLKKPRNYLVHLESIEICFRNAVFKTQLLPTTKTANKLPKQFQKSLCNLQRTIISSS